MITTENISTLKNCTRLTQEEAHQYLIDDQRNMYETGELEKSKGYIQSEEEFYDFLFVFIQNPF